MGDSTAPDARGTLAKQMFPEAWARAESQQDGHKRRRQKHHLRKLAESRVRADELRRTGACCGNCRHGGEPNPAFAPEIAARRLRCAVESDYHGDAHVDRDDLCHRWAAKPPESN